ncbi:MAG TPA: protein translocase subunit SecD [Gemmatimonadales bacterium]|jgi:preprotein translocase subunit SecD|nr:protein translocase subunit SecD [Gemmatimonadales bacterium]
MFDSIRTRLIIIGLLILASGYFLFPRSIITRVPTASGAMKDSVETRIPIKRGLDLQGGMHLELELDQSKQVSSDVKRDIELALQVLRKRIDEFGVAEPLIQKQGDTRIVVELAGITDPDRAKDIVQQSAFLEFRLTDKTNALDKSLPAMDRALRNLGITGAAPGEKAKPSAVQELLGGDTTARADSAKADSTAADSSSTGSGILQDLIQPSGQMPGEYVVREAAYPRVDSLLHVPEVERALSRGVTLFWGSEPVSIGVESFRYLYALDTRAMITGDRLVDAQAQLDPITNGPVVNFELDHAGGRRFGEATGRHIGDYMAIILDGEVQGRPPVIQDQIGRSGRITLQGKSIEDANDLALTLRAGSLPIPLKIVAEGQVGASLGADSISGGLTAGLVGTLLVVLIMVGYYRMSGALAVLALMLYLLFTLAGLAALGATLTLPGLAGLVLSVGIAVDANVLIFERIREELQHGKSVRLSVDEGFRHAMNAIVDSNVSTVLTALFLFQFGTGPVKGFAVTLIIGIIASMITAIFVTRTFFLLWLQRRPEMATLSI